MHTAAYDGKKIVSALDAITVSGKVRAAWYATGTILVAVCNRIFTRSSWLVSVSKFAAKGGRRKKRRTKLREAGGGDI